MSGVRRPSVDFGHLDGGGKLPDMDLLPEDGVDFAHSFFQQGHGDFPMDLMEGGGIIKWTVERERGMSFDFTALCDTDVKREEPGEINVDTEDAEATEVPMDSETKTETRAALANLPTSQVYVKPEPSKSSGKRQWAQSNVVLRAKTRSQAALQRPALPSETSQMSTILQEQVQVEGSGGGGLLEKDTPTYAATSDTGVVCNDPRAVSSFAGGRRGLGPGGGEGSSTTYKVGAYTLEERAAIVAKFHAKRGRRIWRKKIKYDCRKKLADKRPRLKGRFVTQEELEGGTCPGRGGGGGGDARRRRRYNPQDSGSSEADEDSEDDSEWPAPLPTTPMPAPKSVVCGGRRGCSRGGRGGAGGVVEKVADTPGACGKMPRARGGKVGAPSVGPTATREAAAAGVERPTPLLPAAAVALGVGGVELGGKEEVTVAAVEVVGNVDLDSEIIVGGTEEGDNPEIRGGDGDGYEFLVDDLLVDPLPPSIVPRGARQSFSLAAVAVQ